MLPHFAVSLFNILVRWSFMYGIRKKYIVFSVMWYLLFYFNKNPFKIIDFPWISIKKTGKCYFIQNMYPKYLKCPQWFREWHLSSTFQSRNNYSRNYEYVLLCTVCFKRYDFKLNKDLNPKIVENYLKSLEHNLLEWSTAL